MASIPMRSTRRPLVHVVVSCKSRKTVAVPEALRMSSIAGQQSFQDRLGQWIDRLDNSSAAAYPAANLYAGDHWKVVLRIPAAAPELDIKLWVASAGYGLVSIDTPLKPYSATFIRPHAETVTPKGCEFSAVDWWRALGTWKPNRGQPRQLVDLARSTRESGGFLLLALSEPYALALADDISAASHMEPDRVALVSVGLASASTAPHGIERALLPVESRLKKLVGGAMQGVNARLAHKIIAESESWHPNVPRLNELIRGWVASVDPLPRYARDRMSDQDVRSFIHAHADSPAGRSKSTLLRQLRDSGKACEQARFGRLYGAVTGKAGASPGDHS